LPDPDLMARLRAHLNADEQWALAASQPYEYADAGAKVPLDGVHWTWVTGENWDPVIPDPAVDKFVGEPGESCNLVSVETWPCSSGRRATPWMAPRRVADSMIEVDTSAAGHIARHDPARVLREVTAKRTILAEHYRMEDGVCNSCSGVFMQAWPCPTVRALAAVYGEEVVASG
jgi:uncharacterized protein DUF6221